MIKVKCVCGWEYAKIDQDFIEYLKLETDEIRKWPEYWNDYFGKWATDDQGYEWLASVEDKCRNNECSTNEQ